MNTITSRRILLIDDMPSIHDDFRKILAPRESAESLDHAEAALFGQPPPFPRNDFELD
jgi:two-component system, NtrC family, sensor kinase